MEAGEFVDLISGITTRYEKQSSDNNNEIDLNNTPKKARARNWKRKK